MEPVITVENNDENTTTQVATMSVDKNDQWMPMVTDDEGEQFPAVSEEAMNIRKKRLGLDNPKVEQFFGQWEFVSLGACCAVSRSLQYLGLKKHSYPFDWLRAPVEGVIHLLDTDFVDFLTYTTDNKGENQTIYSGTRWGGSFWHHNPGDARSLRDFTRRVRRFVGLEEVDASTPRCFVRAVNTSRELEATLRLRDSLRRSLPNTPIYLFVLVDSQRFKGLLEIDGSEGADILFYFIHEDDYGDGTKAATERMLQTYGENYAAALAFALRRWAGDPEVVISRTVASLSELSDLCEQFDGGDCASALFGPARFQGQRLRVRENTPDSLPHLIEARKATFLLPDHAVPGSQLEFAAFEGKYCVPVPEDAKPGALVTLELREGRLFMGVADPK